MFKTIERTDEKLVKYLMTLTCDDMVELGVFDKCKTKKEQNENFVKVQNYLKDLHAHDCVIECEYNYSKNNKTKSGRLFCGKSIQAISYMVRGFLFKHTTDIDMQNCHPKILKYICDKNGIPCNQLNDYIKNREEYLNLGERDTIKTLILKSLNDEKVNKRIEYAEIRRLDREFKNIQDTLFKIDEYQDLKQNMDKDKKYNPKGSFINQVLCKYENDIMNVVVEYLKQEKYEICSLMFDGCMIYGNHYENNDLLRNIENIINEKFEGLDMVFTYKEHDNTIELPEDFDPSTADIPEDYETMKINFEKNICKIIQKAFYIEEDFETNTIIIYKENDLKIAYRHLKFWGYDEKKKKNTEKSFIKEWLEDKKIRKYKTVVVCPPPLIPKMDEFNLWRPFDYELITEYEEKPEAVEMFKKHLSILCNHQEEVAEYMIDWLGQMIKLPAIKTICPTLISEEGAGKGTLLKLMGKMLGNERVFETTQPSRDVWGNFNSLMTSAYLVNLNELERKDTIEAEGKIKGLITDGKLTINPKGITPYPITSFHRFINTTNKEEPIGTHKKDRRNLIIRSSDELVIKTPNNVEYFVNINKMIEDVDSVKTIFEFLKNRPNLETFHLRDKPKTQYQEDLSELNRPVWDLFLEQFTLNHYDDCKFDIYKKTVFDEFTTWSKSNGFKFDITNKSLQAKLKRLNLDGFTCGGHTKKGYIWNVDIEKLKTHYNLENVSDGIDGTDSEDEENDLDYM